MFCLVAETTDVFDATENMMAFFMLFHLVGVSSVCTNPILYGFLNENFKKVTKKLKLNELVLAPINKDKRHNGPKELSL